MYLPSSDELEIGKLLEGPVEIAEHEPARYARTSTSSVSIAWAAWVTEFRSLADVQSSASCCSAIGLQAALRRERRLNPVARAFVATAAPKLSSRRPELASPNWHWRPRPASHWLAGPGVALGIEPLDGLDERQALERPLDLGPVAHDQDRHLAGVMYSRATRSTSALVTASTRA